MKVELYTLDIVVIVVTNKRISSALHACPIWHVDVSKARKLRVRGLHTELTVLVDTNTATIGECPVGPVADLHNTDLVYLDTFSVEFSIFVVLTDINLAIC